MVRELDVEQWKEELAAGVRRFARAHARPGGQELSTCRPHCSGGPCPPPSSAPPRLPSSLKCAPLRLMNWAPWLPAAALGSQ